MAENQGSTHLRHPPSCGASNPSACLLVFCSEISPFQPSSPAPPSPCQPSPAGASAFQPAPSIAVMMVSDEQQSGERRSEGYRQARRSMCRCPSWWMLRVVDVLVRERSLKILLRAHYPHASATPSAQTAALSGSLTSSGSRLAVKSSRACLGSEREKQTPDRKADVESVKRKRRLCCLLLSNSKKKLEADEVAWLPRPRGRSIVPSLPSFLLNVERKGRKAQGVRQARGQ